MGTYLCLCVHTDRQTDRQTDRRTERQTKMHTCMYTYIQTYIHTHAYCSVLRCPDVMNAPFCFFPSPPDTLTSPICCRSRRWSNFSKSAPKTRRSRKLHTHTRAHTHAHTHTHIHTCIHTYIHGGLVAFWFNPTSTRRHARVSSVPQLHRTRNHEQSLTLTLTL
jgi:hypothetical protein